MDHEAWAVEVRHWEQEACVQAESQALDGGKVHTVVPGGSPAEQATPCVHTAESWEPVGGWRAHEVEELPSALQHVEGEEADAAGADAQGGGREVSDVCAMPPVWLERGCGEEVG